MKENKNLNGNLSIQAFSIENEYIDVLFSDEKVYRYLYRSAGAAKIEEMKRLANQDYGLNSYIIRCAKMDYEKRNK